MPRIPWWKLGKIQPVTHPLFTIHGILSLSVCNTYPACSPLQVMYFGGLAMCDTAGSPRHWSQEQGLLDFWFLVWIIIVIVFFPSTQCGFSQSHTLYAFKRSHHDSRGVEGSQKPQNDIMLSGCGYHPLLQRTGSDVNTPTTATPDFPTGMIADIQAKCWEAARRAGQQRAVSLAECPSC